MFIGAHVSIAGGLKTAIKEADYLGIKTLQIFSSSPRIWEGSDRLRPQIGFWQKSVEQKKIKPVFIHGKYLINLGSPDKVIIGKSVKSLVSDLKFCEKINADGVIFHPGSFKNSSKSQSMMGIISAVREILAKTNSVNLVFENSAGAGQTIGSDIDDIAWLIKKMGSPRIKYCFDTCHAFVSGYDLRTAGKVDRVVKIIKQKIGLDKLVCIHANDSIYPLGSNKDRHANIGQGYIGKKGFGFLLNHKDLKRIPFIIETPNLKESKGKIDLSVLNSLVKK